MISFYDCAKIFFWMCVSFQALCTQPLSAQLTYVCSDLKNCQKQSVDYLQKYLKPWPKVSDYVNDDKIESYTDLDFVKTKTRKVGILFVYVHGLWEGAHQFSGEVVSDFYFSSQNRLKQELLKKELANTQSQQTGEISKSWWTLVKDSNLFANMILTLPGHGADLAQSDTVTYMDWKIYLHKILQATRDVADNVVLIGQSVGGVLSLVEAMDNPNLVDFLWLIEPAIKVDSTKLNLVCLGKSVMEDASSFGSLANMVGFNISGYTKIPIHFGCEVKNIWFEYLFRQGFIPNNFRENLDYDNLFDISKKAIKRLKTPTLLEKNLNDDVIDNSILEIFSSLNVTGTKFMKYENSSSKHGLLATKYGSFYFEPKLMKLILNNLDFVSETSNKFLLTYLLHLRIENILDLTYYFKPDEGLYYKEELIFLVTNLLIDRGNVFYNFSSCRKYLDGVNRLLGEQVPVELLYKNLQALEFRESHKNCLDNFTSYTYEK